MNLLLGCIDVNLLATLIVYWVLIGWCRAGYKCVVTTWSNRSSPWSCCYNLDEIANGRLPK